MKWVKLKSVQYERKLCPRFDCRHIPDLEVGENCTNEKFGIELAEKLEETHTELMGKDICCWIHI